MYRINKLTIGILIPSLLLVSCSIHVPHVSSPSSALSINSSPAQSTRAEGGYPALNPSKASEMPLYAMEENEANNLLSGVYWNGDRWLVRRLVLRSDGTYIYTQQGDSRPPCDWTNREAYSGGAARHFELYRNLNWVLEGRWFFGSNKKHIIRLEIDQYQLKDTSGSLPMDAFLEIPVVPDPKEGNAVFVPTETAVFGEPLEEATVRFPGGARLSYDKRKGILLDTHDNWPPFKECIERKTDGDRWFYPTRTIYGKRLLPVKDSERTSGE